MAKINDAHVAEKRKHPRLPVIQGIVEPVNLIYESPKEKKEKKENRLPAILSDLSAGGMRLITFLEAPEAKEVTIQLELLNLHKLEITGAIIWIREKSGVYTLGIEFKDMSQPTIAKINFMVKDFTDCDSRILQKLTEICVKTCSAHLLCNKLHKNEDFWQNAG